MKNEKLIHPEESRNCDNCNSQITFDSDDCEVCEHERNWKIAEEYFSYDND